MADHTFDLPTLNSLRDRVRAAKGADRELDVAIATALLDPAEEKNYWFWQGSRSKGTPLREATSYWKGRAHCYTASIDAAVGLIWRVAPRANWELKCDGAHVGDIVYFASVGEAEEIYDDIPAMALVHALLNYLIACASRAAVASEGGRNK